MHHLIATFFADNPTFAFCHSRLFLLRLRSILLVCALGAFTALGLAQPAAARVAGEDELVLSSDERAYLRRLGPVYMCVDPDWAPFERINAESQHEGIAADLLRLIAHRLGIDLRLLPTRTWQESLDASMRGRCQIMSFLNQTPARETWLLFTEPVFSDPNVIVTREEHPYIADLHGLRGQTVALPAGTMVEERLRRDYPELQLIATQSERESVALVSERKADMTVRTLIGAAYAIRKEGLFNLKIAGQLPEYTNHLRIGVIRSEPQLRAILDKGVASLSAQEKEAIWNRHVAVTVQQGLDYRLLWQIVGGAGLLLALTVYWNRKLRRLNRELARLSVTDRLTGLANRMCLDQTLAREVTRCQRFKQPFSLILLDVDRFKQINDNYGHPIGDQVLQLVAQTLRAGIRRTDTLGRWGGEEFMLICPQTDLAGALTLADNLRQTLATTAAPEIPRVTASFGVASHHANDRPEDLVGRADSALYRAKHAGRNQVVAESLAQAVPAAS